MTVLTQYMLPSIKGEGWANVVIGDDGFFAAVSDYGNYAFWWTHIGKRTFKEFLLSADGDYVHNKLDSSKHFDSDATIDNLKDAICQHRRKNPTRLSKRNARFAWDEAEGIADEWNLRDWIEEFGDNFDHDFYEASVYSSRGDIVGFIKHILPRIKAAIREELDAGRSVSTESV